MGARWAKSLPARGVWIEIELKVIDELSAVVSLPARGVWIEIGVMADCPYLRTRRSPQGECGLK